MKTLSLSPFFLLAAMAATAPQAVRADTTQCTQVSSLPATLSQQGVYCLKSNLVVSSNASALVSIAANNITLDCNGYSITQLGSGTAGIKAVNQSNATIRNCTIKGTQTGITVHGSGHLVENNQVMGAASIGIQLDGSSLIARGNRVLATGGQSTTIFPRGIVSTGRADIVDNTVAGVAAWAGSGHAAVGIDVTYNPDGDVSANRISGLDSDGMLSSVGISVTQALRLSVRGNVIVGDGNDKGIACPITNMALATDNRLLDTGTAIFQCTADDNLIAP